jgi:2',3'-cyclic-nucleotide 2'-phosphodiesterase (5'-nucleotidase family)
MPVIGQRKVGGYPELSSALQSYRNRRNTSTFFLFGGNSLAPSPLSSLDRGTHIIDILNSLEPDVMSVTKREFTYFEDELSLRSYEAAFPLISSNVYDKRSKANVDGILDYVIVEQKGVKVGVISVLDDSAITDYLLKQIVIRNPQQIITETSRTVREKGADIVILMYSYSFPFIDHLLSKGVVDISITTTPEYTILPSEILPTHPNAVVLNELNHLAEINVIVHKNRTPAFEMSWVEKSLADFSQEPIVAGQVKGYISRLNRLLDQPIAKVTEGFQTLRNTVRTQENAFANSVADSLRVFADADMAIINGGIIRGNRSYSAGQQLTRREIAEELPFRSKLAVLTVTGLQLRSAIENGLSQIEQVRGRFPQVSGIEVKYDSSQKPGERVISITLDGKEIEPTHGYKLATTDYMAQGGDGYQVLNACPQITLGYMEPPMIVDVFLESMRASKLLGPKLNARLVDIHE